MLDSIFGITDSTVMTVSLGSFLICVAASLVLGLVIAGCYAMRSRYTKSFVLTLALLPAIICVIIMMVNGNIGTGIAVAGAFTLVRFRSVPGTAKEICMIFLAMATGLVTGMGYIGIAAIFVAVICAAFLIYDAIDFGATKRAGMYKTFRITIPEDLDYTGVFEEVFDEYATSCELTTVKTTNMGSMFKLTYDVVLKDPSREKELIDKLRYRNGNLEITVSKQAAVTTEL